MPTTDHHPPHTPAPPDAVQGNAVPPEVDAISPARWWAVLLLTAWVSTAIAWLVSIHRGQIAGGVRSSIDWIFLVPCAVLAALLGALQAGPKARLWGALLVLAVLLTAIALLATLLGTPRDWWA